MYVVIYIYIYVCVCICMYVCMYFCCGSVVLPVAEVSSFAYACMCASLDTAFDAQKCIFMYVFHTYIQFLCVRMCL